MSSIAFPVTAPSLSAHPTQPQVIVAGVAGGPKLILRLEAGLVLAAACFAYGRLGHGWGMFALLFLTPDLSMLGYLGGRRLGAAAYNLAHSYVSPALLAAAGWISGHPLMIGLSLIWIAHIGFDRVLGYGLKYASAFGHTHLGAVGKR